MTDTAKVQATNVNIVRALRDMNPNTRIPDPLKNSINDIYNEILNVEPVRNEFIASLIGRIALTQINASYFRNPLTALKTDPMRYGLTEQEIYVNMVKGKTFDAFAGTDELFAFYDSNVMAAYHKINPPMQYPLTITYDNLRMAFTSDYGIRDLINAKVQAVYASAEYDEYLTMKMLIESAYEKGQLYNVQVSGNNDADAARALTIAMKSYINQMKFPHPEYNIAGATSSALENGIYYMVTPEMDAVLDVDVLATAFHDSKVDITAHKIIVDKFANSEIKAVLFDMRWFKVRENFRTMSDSRNGAALTWNYFYTLSQMYSYSPFFPMIIFTTAENAVETITVEDTTASKGTTVEIKASASNSGGTGYVSQVFDYSVSGNQSTFTKFVPGSNILSIGNDEKASELTVTVTSRTDNTISGTGTVTIS